MDTTVVILSAGMGTRMGSNESNIPKGLIKVGVRTILERPIDTFLDCGVKKSIS